MRGSCAEYNLTSNPASALAARPNTTEALVPTPTNDANVTLSIPGLFAASYTLVVWAVSQGELPPPPHTHTVLCGIVS